MCGNGNAQRGQQRAGKSHGSMARQSSHSTAAACREGARHAAQQGGTARATSSETMPRIVARKV
jgi:hypothetical protein